MPHALAATADLLPTAGDLTPDCSCPDDGFPCKHAAALCYQTARLLDEDPFVLFLMRGRGEHEILADLTRRNATRSAAERGASAPPMPTVDAAAAVTSHPQRTLPPPFPLPANPGRPPVYPHTTGAPDPLALDLLATEAAARAHTFLATGIDPVGGLTPGRTPSVWPRPPRLRPHRLHPRPLPRPRGGHGPHPHGPLTRRRRLAPGRPRGPVRPGRALGPTRRPLRPGPPRPDRGRLPHLRPWRNRLSERSLQLRFGRDGLWYGYESDPDQEDWWPRAPRTRTRWAH